MRIVKKTVVTILIISAIATMLPTLSTANDTIAWGAANVSGNNVRIRSGPGLTHSTITNVNLDEIVVIVERTNSEWNKVSYHGTEGFMSTQFLDRSREAANFNKKGTVTGATVNMRKEPNTTSDILSTHSSGVEMSIVGINNGWYKVKHSDQTGYIRSDLMSLVSQSSSSNPAKGEGGSSSGSSSAPVNLTQGQKIAEFAKGFVGHRYVWAGMSPGGFDCSGFTSYVMRQHGVRLTRNASGQYKNDGVKVNKSDLAPADLVFFSSNGGRSVTHVGLYIGNNKFVHASSTRKGVIISDLTSAYYTRVWYGAKRVI
ncbi:MAG: NlpC/P60 family protein [Oscillospiraceae bacterium]|nr:NlpC/P60 family protein [Oscillospiraceae bacterium]